MIIFPISKLEGVFSYITSIMEENIDKGISEVGENQILTF